MSQTTDKLTYMESELAIRLRINNLHVSFGLDGNVKFQ